MVSDMSRHSTIWLPVEKCQLACKPGSVPQGLTPKAVTIHLEHLLPSASRNQPGRQGRKSLTFLRISCHPYSVLLPVGFAMPPPLLAARCAFTAPFHPYRNRPGGSFSVALSLGSPPPDVIRHRISVEPGLSSTAPFRDLRQRSPGQLAGGG